MVTKQNGLMSGEHKRHRPSSCSAVLLICGHQIIAFVLTVGITLDKYNSQWNTSIKVQQMSFEKVSKSNS